MKKYLFISVIVLLVVGYAVFGHNTKTTEEYKNSVNDIAQISKQYDSGCMVLSYHQVKTGTPLYNRLGYRPLDNEYQLYNVYLKDFEAQMADLASNDVKVLSVDDMYIKMKAKTLPDKCALITFDDVDQTVYDNAYPILEEYKFPFTLFPVIDKMGEEYEYGKYASENEIKDMQASGLATVGLHTFDMHKQDKNGKGVFLNKDKLGQFKEDTNQSIKAYRETFGKLPKYFAYPFGLGIPETDSILMNDGIKAIFTLRRGVINNESKSFYMPRVLVTKLNFPLIVDWLTK